MDDTNPPEAVQRYTCDSCSRSIPPHEARYACQDCHDFDYCAQCFTDAPLIHPGHSFAAIEPAEPSPAQEARPEAEANGRPRAESKDPGGLRVVRLALDTENPGCRSCAAVTSALPVVHFLLDGKGVPVRRPFFQWPLRISRLVEATQRGCPFCCFVLHTFFRSSNIEYHSYEEETPWYAEPSKHDDERGKLVRHCMRTLTRLKSDRFVFDVLPMCTRKGARPPDYDKIRISLSHEATVKFQDPDEVRKAGVFHSAGVVAMERYICAARGDPASEHITTQPPNPAAASARGIQQIKEWIRICDEHHGAACRPPSSGALPSRLIDVSDRDTLRLHETRPGERLRYATLSYCWGGPQTFQTATATVAARVRGFSVGDLPQTLRDAVRLAQALGLRYLWVDSLCIIQDSAGDKSDQVARMADIYRNAYLTISAARAASAAEGFLADRSNPKTGLWKALVPLSYPLPDASATTLDEASSLPRRRDPAGTVYILEEPPSMSAHNPDPVSTRAWCLQERVLSPRLLSFGRWPTWRCGRLAASDGGYYSEEGRAVEEGQAPATWAFSDTAAAAAAEAGAEAAEAEAEALTTQRPPPPPDHFRTSQLLAAWRALLQDYTRRRLTFPGDKLPAIAGIAREVARRTGMQYRAGLWEGDALRELMWYARALEWRVRAANPWRAPSWSWASVDAPVLCDAVTDDARPLARVLRCEVVEAEGEGRSGYEMVRGGTVEVRGPVAELARPDVAALLRAQDLSPAQPVSEDVQDWYAQIMEDLATRPAERVPVEEGLAELPERVFGLMLFTRDWVGNRWDKGRPKVSGTCYFGLLLREVEGGRFERIGAFWNDTSEMLDQTARPWEERTLELI